MSKKIEVGDLITSLKTKEKFLIVKEEKDLFPSFKMMDIKNKLFFYFDRSMLESIAYTHHKPK